ncbi:MAG: serine hydrolase [Formivibrio sp.]|nr:serine hydrolase [Formivibrio sp.]
MDTSDSEAQRYANNSNLQQEVDGLAQPLIEHGQTPGLVLGVLLANGESRFYSYGVADKTTNQPMNPDTLFDIGSLSKGFLGVITAQLVDEGVLSWDTTVAELLPPDVPLSADARKITVQQLATHTSGLPRQPFTLQTLSYFMEYLFTGNNFYRHFDREFTLNYLAGFEAPSKVEPAYSNIGYGLLGYLVERRTGKTLETLLSEKIIQPLGMARTGYDLEHVTGVLNRAYGYAGDQPKFIPRGSAVPDWQFTELMKGSSAMYSNARDLLAFAKAYMDKPSSMEPALEDTLRIRIPRAKEAAAIAWVEDDINQQHIAYQIGLVAGYTSFIGLDTRHHQAIVVLQNSFNWSANIGYQLLVRLGSAQDIRQRLALAQGHVP